MEIAGNVIKLKEQPYSVVENDGFFL